MLTEVSLGDCNISSSFCRVFRSFLFSVFFSSFLGGPFSFPCLIRRLGITREALGEHICKLFGFVLISLPLLFIQEKTDISNDPVLSARCICGCIQQTLFISWFFVNIRSLKSELESKHQHKKLELVGQLNQILVFCLVYIVFSISVWVYQLVSDNRDRYWQQWWLY